MRSSKALAAGSALLVLATSGVSAAQTARDDYDYHFEEDDLLAETLSSPPPLLQLRPKGRRVMLIRPRASFAAELIATVETL